MKLKPGKLYKVTKKFLVRDPTKIHPHLILKKKSIVMFLEERNRTILKYIFLTPNGKKMVSAQYGIDHMPDEYLEEIQEEYKK